MEKLFALTQMHQVSLVIRLVPKKGGPVVPTLDHVVRVVRKNHSERSGHTAKIGRRNSTRQAETISVLPGGNADVGAKINLTLFKIGATYRRSGQARSG